MTRILGEFRLGARLGQGGMGEVYQALHAPTGTPAAVKVLRRGDADHLRAMEAEIRSVAALDHPHVIAILDAGTAPGEENRWFAMELCARGDLARHARALSWSLVRRLLDELLDALSHAHARGVIHRDLKPENVLLAGARDPRPGWRLTDFGIAFAEDDPGASAVESPRGSPRYMAPEQFSGYRRDLGPWTDLYGLGCLTWAVLTGEPPFSGSTGRLARAHAEEALPPFQPDRPVPAGLVDWLRLMLAKRPDRRFSSAADAADALARLDRDLAGASASSTVTPGEAQNPTFHLSLATVPTQPVLQAVDEDLPPRPPPARPPPSWRDDAPVAPRPALTTRSVALFGVRRPPFVGRDEERDRLWELLRGVHADRRLRIALLEAPLGTGCSRLAEWVVHRARETGVAHGFRVGHGPWGEGGLADLVGEMLHLHGLRGEALRGRLLWLASQGAILTVQVGALAEIVEPTGRPTTEEQRLRVVGDLLAQLAVDRPVVLWMDDLHWGPVARALVEHLRQRGDVPALVVATCVPSSLADDPRGPAACAALLGEGDRRFALRPLDPAATRALVQGTLHLDDQLAARLEARAAGHPLHVLSLIESWVVSGSLEAGPYGYRLRELAEVGMPATLREVVEVQLDQALKGRSLDDAVALEIAGALGESFEVRAWARACLLAGAAPAPDLVPHLVSEGIWRPSEEVGGTPYFSSPLFHAAVKDRARRSGQEPRWHRACAAALTEMGGAPERIARHLLRAGEPGAAVPPLTQAAETALEAGDLAAAGRWIARLETAVRAAGEEHAPAGLRARLAGATLQVLRGTVDGADEEIEAILQATVGMPRIAARAWVLKGRRLTRKRRFEAAFDAIQRAAELASADPPLAAQIEVTRANLLLHLGRLEEAEAALRRARPGSRALPGDLGRIALAHARVALRRGATEVASGRAAEAAEWFLAAGSAWGRLAALDLLADVAAESGDLDAAEQRYRETERGYKSLGLRQAEVSRLHLGWLAFRQGRYPEARATFDHAIGVFAAWRTPLYLDLAWAGRMASDAAAGDAGAFDEALEHLQRDREGPWTAEVRACLLDAARLAAERLDARRAAAARTLAETG